MFKKHQGYFSILSFDDFALVFGLLSSFVFIVPLHTLFQTSPSTGCYHLPLHQQRERSLEKLALQKSVCWRLYSCRIFIMTKMNPTVCDFFSQNWSFDANDPFLNRFKSTSQSKRPKDTSTTYTTNIYVYINAMSAFGFMGSVGCFFHLPNGKTKKTVLTLSPTHSGTAPSRFFRRSRRIAPREPGWPAKMTQMTWLGISWLVTASKQPRPFWSARSVGFAGVRKGEIFPCFSSWL